MEYSKLSDDEINNMVGRVVSQRFRTDYCNDPCAAWPIIVKNRISIINLDEDEWGARGVADRNSKRAIHENSLRAAMIVFLLMQESQHA
ncbi:phage protein NinX family protein [Cronobacter sakazakii]|uniref:phage protein NinX family protein n=1 Tax=Cronobacter sakazakii TaxID=28141 RepID=UPI000CFD612D|nr:phage protein NinX family protein [Cronobacter sakazakii]